MRTKFTMSIIGAAVALGSGGIAATGAVASSAAVSAAKRHVEGRVVAINRPGRTFTVRDTERGTLKVKVTSSTSFERIAGFSALRISERVDVRATQIDSSWRATVVEPSGGNIAHNGADDVRHSGIDDRVSHSGADGGVSHHEPNDR